MQSDHPLASRARGRVGTTLRDKWHLDALLGVGGMAAVYAATHRNGKRAAVKILHAELAMDEALRGRFLREGYAANKVGHAGAVSVIDDDTAEDGAVYLVMDLLEGETLESKRERNGGKLRPNEVLDAIDQVLDVLAAAHDKGIVHRDIKPENLFITHDGRVKVLDFGIARVRELSTASTATNAGSTMGTPAFMPPEQARGRWEQVDGRADIFAVGATMFTLLTGRLVHEARTPNEQLLAAMTAHVPSIASVSPSLPEALVRMIDKALAFAPEDRWSDARAMQAEAGAVRSQLADDSLVSAPTLPVSEPPPGAGSGVELRLTTGSAVVTANTGSAARSRRTIPWLIGAAAMALAGSAVIFALRPNPHPATSPSSGLQSPMIPTGSEYVPSDHASAPRLSSAAPAATASAPLEVPSAIPKPARPKAATPSRTTAPAGPDPDDMMDKRK